MQYLRVGHHTNVERNTGVSVFLFEKPAVAAHWICGSAPATYELAVLDLDAAVTHIDGLVLMGGSAFGLPAVNGALQWLKEQNRGWPTLHAAVPIVPAAAIFDLGCGPALPPTEKDAYLACLSANTANHSSGKIGAGTGASVGKLIPNTLSMPGGIGYAEINLANGVSVLAYAVVNSIGDVRDKTNAIIAGARLQNGEFANCESYLLSGNNEKSVDANTTLVAIFTNAKFSKIELKRIAKMAVAGLGRAISPIFTEYDGDIIFCVSLGDLVISELVIGAIAAEVTQQAIINAVKNK